MTVALPISIRTRLRDVKNIRLVPIILVFALLPFAATAASEPTEDSVQLQTGRIKSVHWEAALLSASKSRDANYTCISLALRPKPKDPASAPLEVMPTSSTCSNLLGRPILLAVVDEAVHPQVTVLTMEFQSTAHWVALDLVGQPDRRISLSLLSPQKAHQASVNRFRYATVSFLGDYCLRRFTAYSRKNIVVAAGGPMPCPH